MKITGWEVLFRGHRLAGRLLSFLSSGLDLAGTPPAVSYEVFLRS